MEKKMNTTVFNILKEGTSYLSVIGLGYVGGPLAVAFSKRGIKVIGFDSNREKVERYAAGFDPVGEMGADEVCSSGVFFTADEDQLKEAIFHIIAVPTPVNCDHTPDLSFVIQASKTLAKNLQRGSVVVYESTVYPGVTEDICIPILESISGMKCGKDFKVGYSPERINPGDKVHRLENITKIVSGVDIDSVAEIRNVYDLIIEAGTYPVSTIKTAEAIKVVENSQRDVNIAFMNELAMVFDRMGIDTNEVVDGMNTKWNALGFRPGLVGGHCIGVDPYYFTYEAEKLGYHSQIVLNGRSVNDKMGEFIADIAIKNLIIAGHAPKKAKVAVLGFTFKENCSDIRNTRVHDVIKRLNEYDITPIVVDPWADKQEVFREYQILIEDISAVNGVDCIIVAVAHDQFKNLSLERVKLMYREQNDDQKVFLDVKGIFSIEEIRKTGMKWWRL